MFLLFPLLVLVSGDDVGYFFHLSDVHLDLEYAPNTDPLNRCINGSIPKNNTAGAWGNPICDTPVRAYQRALDAMKSVNPKPDFIFYTGDSVPHWLMYWSVQQYTEEMVVSGISSVIALLRATFPDTPIYPALGNHDNYLSDQLPHPPLSDRWMTFIAQTWARLLPEDALETVRYGGYYTVSINPKLRLIHFNSIHCDGANLYAVLNQTDHANQFVWFKNTLARARAAGEKVYVIGHITPTDYFDYCLQNYLDLATKYADIIAAHFYGDRHSDEFRSKQDPSKAVGMIYVMPSIVPETWFNPSFRQSNGTLIDYHHYYAELGNGQTPLAFKLEYSAKAAYQLSDMSPSSWLDSWEQMWTNDTLWLNFKTFYTTSFPWNCTGSCKTQMLQMIGMAPKQEHSWARPLTFIGPPVDIIKAGHDHPLYHQWKEQSMTAHPQFHLNNVCEVCLLAMDMLDALLETGASNHEILLGLQQICPYQGAFIERVCVGFVWLYGPFSLPIIALEENPQRVCSALKVCSGV